MIWEQGSQGSISCLSQARACVPSDHHGNTALLVMMYVVTLSGDMTLGAWRLLREGEALTLPWLFGSLNSLIHFCLTPRTQ